MKIKSIIAIVLFLLTFALGAQNTDVSTHQIRWTGVQKWFANSASKELITFDSAIYPTETDLPYFNKRLAVDPSAIVEVNLSDATYIPLSSDEKRIFPASADLSDNVLVKTSFLREKGNKKLDIQIFPFVKRDGQILKLNVFKLAVTTVQGQQKTKASTRHTYAQNSVLANGRFVKIRVTNAGVYKLTFDDLSSMGLNPANVRIFGYGGNVLDQSFLNFKHDDLPELAIYMEKGNDAVFNSGDYVLFYANGITKWGFDKNRMMFLHQANPYSNYSYYFVTSDAGEGKKIQTKNIEVPEQVIIEPIEEFTDYKVYEKDLISVASSGKEFYGETFLETLSLNVNFDFPNVVKSTSFKVRLDVAASSISPAGTPASSFNLSLDNSQTKNLVVAKRTDGDNYEKAKAANAILYFTPQNDNPTFNLNYVKPTSTSTGYLNYILVNARRSLIMSGSAMQFQNVDYLGTNKYAQYKLSNAGANVQIWDITDHANLKQISTQTVDSKLSFIDSATDLKSYLAVDPKAASAFSKPEIVGVVPNQNLHGISQADMVIITHPRFLSQSERLAQAHREMDQLSVAVVTTDQVYNEFSSGAPDATSYRWLMKMLYDRALNSGIEADLPKYLLLFGRGTYDNRKLLNSSSENLIITYQADNSLVETLSYVTDDYFGFLDDEEGLQVPSHLLDIGIGRFPVLSASDADHVVNKTIAYMKNSKSGIWKNQLCFLGDDGDGALHMKQADSVTSIIRINNPEYQVNKIYLDAYLQEVSASGQSYPLAKTNFHNMLRNGLFYLNYTGHAGPVGWTNEQILSVADVKSLSNPELPIWVGATCDFLQFDARTVSAGEHVVLNPYGGGIGILSATRPVYASQNFNINRYFTEHLFKKVNGEHLRVGDVVAIAKNNVGTEINKLSYVYVGDPALKLNYPDKYKIVTTKINDNTVFGTDTLKAMSVVTVSGNVVDANGNVVADFNGDLQAIVYDKLQRIITLDNEKEFYDEDPVKYEERRFKFYDRPNKLFAGKANVKNGLFSFSFMLPKDIKYNFGGGRINYYASNTSDGTEANGYFENFVVGGTNTNYTVETDGPEMQLYLNTEGFVSGDKVNETPLFIAKLNDQNGINRVGSGIGHDLFLTIDDDPVQSYVLNDYFEAVSDKYTEGIVTYKLPELTNGKHTLSFRAWDLLNNSTTQQIEFEVVKGMMPQIFSISNYPNPVKNSTRIIVKHDRPETILNTTVDIFDLAGRRIWTFQQANADDITWDLTALTGVKVKAGVYLYRVSINTNGSETYSKTNKMLIVEQ